MYLKCAFSGHRKLHNDFDEALLERVTEDMIKRGSEEFLCGMARGFDLKAADAVLRLKQNYEIRLVCVIPCAEQEKYYPEAEKKLYKKIVENCDEKVVLSDHYFNGCMQMRDRYLVENCDALICYLREKAGGTYYTVCCAQKADKKIIEL